MLGEEWDMQGEGQSLREEIDVIKRKLNSQGQYEEWKRLKVVQCIVLYMHPV